MELAERLQRLAIAAADLVTPGMLVGLGTGSTADAVTRELGRRVAGGLNFTAVPTSDRTEGLARDLGIPLSTLDEIDRLDLGIDGADEIDPALDLVKGGGGALLREKIVVAAARRFVVVAEARKRVTRLGQGFRLPVEVVRFAWEDTRRRLRPLLPDADLRLADGEPYLTDEGHYILDCALPAERDPDALDRDLKRVPGVVEHGLFIGMAERALLGTPEGGVEVLEAS